MTTMIERMAMAIYAKNAAAALGRLPWAKAQDATKESVRDLARAALEEMRVPTEGMSRAVRENCGGFSDSRMYSAFIDAALKEEPKQ